MNDNERMKLRRSRPQRLEDRRGQTRRLDISQPRRKSPDKKEVADAVMRILLIILVSSMALGCRSVERADVLLPTVTPTATPAVTIEEIVTPDPKGKEPWAFEEIDKVVASTGNRNLRDVELKENDIEIRAWGGFGLTATQGFILKRTDNRWAAFAIRPTFHGVRTPKFNVLSLAEPTQSWNNAWQLLLEQDVLMLPDAETIDCRAMIEDGYSYVVEVRKGRNYRTYSYDNPASHFENRCIQADNILKIVRIISTDYGAAGF